MSPVRSRGEKSRIVYIESKANFYFRKGMNTWARALPQRLQQANRPPSTAALIEVASHLYPIPKPRESERVWKGNT